MLHIAIRHIAALHPRTSRLRKRRARQLRAIRPSRRTELWYRAKLASIISHLRAAGTVITNGLRPHWPQVHDAAPPGFEFLLTQGKAKFQNIGKVAADLGTEAANRNLGDVDDRLSAAIKDSLGIDIRGTLRSSGPIGQELRAAARANIELIKSIPEQYFDRLREVVGQAWETGERWESIVAEVQQIGDVTESRGRLIARDQTSRMNAAFNGVRQRELGIDKYVWQTSQDERVRDSHAELDGQTFRWDSPPTNSEGDTGHPGEMGINCRCVASPSVDLDEAPAELSQGANADLDQEAA